MGKKKFSVGKIVVSFFALVVVVFGGTYTWFVVNQKAVSAEKNPQSFIIRKGEAVDSIGNNLLQKKLIRSVPIFKFIVMRDGIATKIQAGSFTLSPSMTTHEIAEALTSGREDLWVTLLEGWRREEIAESLEKTFTENGADFRKETFLKATVGKEGLLFPDTYLFPLGTSEQAVASVLENTLRQKITTKMQADIKSQGKTENQIMTMASLIEREAKSSTARKLVSGILWKRIDNGWPLQVDATLQYAKGYDSIEKTWWKPPYGVDKEIDSPYNTYQNQGLPPAPICSPSLDSIMAAIYPTPSENWYYITDNDGVMRYAETLDQHNQNVNTYLR